MDPDRYDAHQRAVIERLDEMLAERYGRDGDILQRGYRLSLHEAGYGTVGLWSALQATLDDAGTSFQTQDLNTRMDLMLRDLLLHPDDEPTTAWAQLYGYSSETAAARAFRARYGFGIAYGRRMGRLGQWLGTARRQPRSANGQDRLEEARVRIARFRQRASHTAWAALPCRATDPGLEYQRTPASLPRAFPGRGGDARKEPVTRRQFERSVRLSTAVRHWAVTTWLVLIVAAFAERHLM